MSDQAMTNQRIGCVFPGQGSQFVGMMSEMASEFAVVQQTFATASSVLGYDLWEMSQQGPAELLDKTVHTQPALLAASYAAWQVLQSQSAIQPELLAGHSLGEYTALVCAGALDFKDAIKLVAARGEFMQAAVRPGEGAMAAIIGLEDAVVKQLCDEALTGADEVLSPANYNSIGQVVIAGHKEAVERAMVLAKAAGAKLVMQIPVSVPSHCLLMREAADKLAAMLADTVIQTPKMTVINNVSVQPYHDAADIRGGLTKQLYMPVRWVETIQYFVNHGITKIVECGPGKVLTGLIKRIDKSLL